MNQHPRDTVCANFQSKWTTDLFGSNLPKNGFRVANSEN